MLKTMPVNISFMNYDSKRLKLPNSSITCFTIFTIYDSWSVEWISSFPRIHHNNKFVNLNTKSYEFNLRFDFIFVLVHCTYISLLIETNDPFVCKLMELNGRNLNLRNDRICSRFVL